MKLKNKGLSPTGEVFLDGAVRKLAKGAGITFTGSITGRGLHTLVPIAVARLLGPEAFGLYSIGWTVFRILGTLAQAGLNTGILRYTSIYRTSDKSRLKGILLRSLEFSLIAGLLLGTILYWSASWLAEVIFKKPELTSVLRVFSVGVPLMGVMTVAAAGTRASQKMQYAVYSCELLRPAINLALVVAFYFLGWRLFGVVTASVISFGAGLLTAIYYLNRLFPEMFTTRMKPIFETKELLVFSIPLLLVGFLGMLIMWTDTLMLGYFRPANEVGIYRAASQIAILLTMILAAFNAIFAPMIADLYHKQYLEPLHELFKVSAKWTFYFTLPFFLIVLFSAPQILEIVFGVVYLAGALPLIILATAQLVNVGTGSVGNMLIMSGHQKFWFFNTLSMAVVNILLNWLLIPRLGIQGAAIATAISIAGLFMLGLIQVKLILNMTPYDRRYGKGVIAGLLTAVLVAAVRSTLLKTLSPVVSLLVQIIIILGSLTLIFVAFGFDREDRMIWKVIRTRFM